MGFNSLCEKGLIELNLIVIESDIDRNFNWLGQMPDLFIYQNLFHLTSYTFKQLIYNTPWTQARF